MRAGPKFKKSKWPIFWKHLSELLELGIVGVFYPQTLEGGVQLLQVHLDGARDHARGLLEVTASIVESTAHALHDVAVVFGQRHGFDFSVPRLPGRW